MTSVPDTTHCDNAIAVGVNSARNRGKRFGWPALLVATLLVWYAFHAVVVPGQTYDGPRFVLYDQGSFLCAIDNWSRGQTLYAESAWQYGPLALGWFALFASVFGNTAHTLILACAVAIGVAWCLWVQLSATILGRWRAYLFGAVLLLPTMTLPCLLGFNCGPHVAVEVMLAAMVTWTIASWVRTARFGWAVVFGLLLGALQLVRFGPHAVAGVVGVTVMAIGARGMDRRAWRRQVTVAIAGGAVGYLVVFIPYASWLLWRLPPVMAREQLWPIHMLQHYAQMFSERWPSIDSWGEFVRLVVPLLLGVFVAIAAAVRVLRQPSLERRPDVAAMIFPSWYAVALVFGLTHSGYAVIAYAWLALVSVVAVGAFGRRLHWAMAALLVPLAWNNVQNFHALVVREHTLHAEPVRMPNGEALWFTQTGAQQFAALDRCLADDEARHSGQPRHLVTFLAGGGVYHFFARDRIGRHWWFLPEFVRPWEQDVVAADVMKNDFLLVMDTTPPSTGELKIWTPFRPDLGQRFVARLREPRRLPGVGWLLRIEHEKAD